MNVHGASARAVPRWTGVFAPRIAGAFATAPLGELLLAAEIARGKTAPLLVPVAALAVWLFARLPCAAYLAVVVVASSWANVSGWPAISLLGFDVSVAELVLAAALAGSLTWRRERRMLRAESVLIAVFLAAVAAGVFVGVSNGVAWHEAILSTRSMVFYAAFWLALEVFSRQGSRLLVLRLLAFVAVAVVALQVLQLAAGPSRHIFLAGSDPQNVATVQPETNGFLRVRPPGLVLVYVTCSFAACYLLWGPARRRLQVGALLVTTFAGVLLSLNRNMLLGLGFGICAAALLTPRRSRLVAAIVIGGILATVAVGVFRGPGHSNSAIVERVASIGNWSQLNRTTLADRYYENQFAISALKRHPLTGIGWATSYGAELTSSDGGLPITRTRYFIHEQYLGIWLRTGLLGLAVLVAVMGCAVARGTRWTRHRAWDDESWFGAAVITSVVALAASSTVGIYLMNSDSIVPFVSVLGLAAALPLEEQRGKV